jgi:hypothetical protein
MCHTANAGARIESDNHNTGTDRSGPEDSSPPACGDMARVHIHHFNHGFHHSRATGFIIFARPFREYFTTQALALDNACLVCGRISKYFEVRDTVGLVLKTFERF